MTREESALKTRPRRGFWAKRVVASALLAAALVLVAGERCRLIFKATCILYSLSNRNAPFLARAYAAALSQQVIVREVQVPGSSGPIKTLIYSPVGLPNAPLIVAIHGMTPLGVDDPGLRNFAIRTASLGMQVATPEIVSEKSLLVRQEAITNIGDTVLWAAAKQGHPVPLFGGSYAGGLVLVAASQPAYADHVRLVFCVSGYNDILRFVRFYVSNTESAPDGRVLSMAAIPHGPLFMAIQHMDEMVPPSDVDAMRQVAMHELENRRELVQKDLASLSPGERDIFSDLESVRTDQMRARFNLLMKTHAAELESISPHTQLGGIKAPIYLLHGRDDNVIPVTEAEWNVQDAPKGVPVHLYVSTAISHSTLAGRVRFWPGLAVANYMATVFYACGLR